MLCVVHALAKSGPLSVMEVVVSDILNGKIISKMHHSVKSDESVGAKTNNLVLTRSDTNPPVQSQKMVRDWKF